LYEAPYAPSAQEICPNVGPSVVWHLHKIVWYAFIEEFLLTSQRIMTYKIFILER